MESSLVPTPQVENLPQSVPDGFRPPAAAPIDADLRVGEPPAEGGAQLVRYLAALERFKWLILVITIVGTGLGVLATRYLNPEYEVRATIWIENESKGGGPIRADELLDSRAWVQLLKSFVVADSVVWRMKLYLTPSTASDSLVFRDFGLQQRFYPGGYVLRISEDGKKYTLDTSDGIRVEEGATGGPIGESRGFTWSPSPSVLGRDRSIRFTLMQPREASVQLLDRMNALMANDGNFLRLTLLGTDANRTAETMNAITEQFVRVAADLKTRKLSELSSILAEQVAYSAQNLKDAETALETYRINTITLPSEAAPLAPGIAQTQPTVMSNYFQQKIELEALRRDRKAIESVLARAQNGALAVDAFQTIPAVRTAPDLTKALTELSTAEAELRALLFRYKETYKPVQDVQEKIRVLRQETIPAYATALVDQLKIQETDLEGRIGSVSKELQEIPTRTITEQRLTREAAAAEQLYRNLQSRYEENKLAEASAIPDVRILDRAVAPTSPTKNSAPRIILMAFAGSLGLAVGLAILLDRMDKRFRYPDQVSRGLGLQILGAVPAIKNGRPEGQTTEEAAHVVEAFRVIRLNVAHMFTTNGPIEFTVTSPGPSDGKSLVSANLALSFAEAGYRTLLIDGDTRRGELHRIFDVTRTPGLIDCLMGRASVEDVEVPTTHRDLRLLPSGTRVSQSPELLGSPVMRDLLTGIRKRYDVILVDSPPLGAGIDPFVLGTVTRNMLVVFRAGETDRSMAEAKLQILDRLPIRMLGAVLNDIRQGAGIYKYYSYVSGYSVEEDGQEGRLLPVEAESTNGNGANGAKG